MPALKKLIAPGQTLPPDRIILANSTSTGKNTPVDVKQVKDKNGNILWGRYEITTDETIQQFKDKYCKSFSLDFVNPSYGFEAGDYITAYGLSSYRSIPTGYSVVGYHGEQVSCRYTLKDPFYIKFASSSYISDFQSGRTLNEETDPYYQVTQDAFFEWQSDSTAFPNLTAKPKYLYWPGASCTLINYTNGVRGDAAGTSNPVWICVSDLVYDWVGDVTSYHVNLNDTLPVNNALRFIPFGAEIEIRYSTSKPDTLPETGEDYFINLSSHEYSECPKTQNLLPEYFTAPNNNISKISFETHPPIYFNTNPTWTATSVTNLSSGGTGTGYKLTNGNLSLHPLAPLGLDTPINFYADKDGNYFKIGTKNNYLILDSNKYYKLTGNTLRTLGHTWSTIFDHGWVVAHNRLPVLNPAIVKVERPAYFVSQQGQYSYNYTLNKPNDFYAIYSWKDTFWKINFLTSQVAKVTPTTTITGSGFMGVVYQGSDELDISFPQVVIAAPIKGRGKITATIALKLMDSAESEIGKTSLTTKTVNFTDLAAGATILNTTDSYSIVSSNAFPFEDHINSEWCGTFYLDYEIELEGGIKHKGSQISWDVNSVMVQD